jgi:hypothetical protein
MAVEDSTAHMRALARRVADTYIAHCHPRAALLVGSGATGDVDSFSDLDLLLYYDQAPSEASLAAAGQHLAATDVKDTAWHEELGCSERYSIEGVPCQLGHAVIAGWEREIAQVVDDLELDRTLLKQMSGLFEGRPLHGADLITQWRARAAFTERLQRAMIAKHWTFFPWWFYEEKLAARDATIWRYDVLVQSAYNIAGVLAALNQIYFSTFEFKRLGRFVSRLEIVPENLEGRLNALFDPDERASTIVLERLVAETQELVAARFPDLELSIDWGGRPTPPGTRESPHSTG